MLQRHKNLLANKLDQLWYEGVVRIERWEMVSIFQKAKRFSTYPPEAA